MKRILIFLIIVIFASVNTAAECFLVTEDKDKQNSDMISAFAVKVISNYVEPVSELDTLESSGQECVYRLTLTDVGDGRLLILKGPHRSAFAESESGTVKDFQKALLDVVIQLEPQALSQICADYSQLIEKRCKQKKEVVTTASENTVVDLETGLEWQKSGNERMSWQDALSACRDLTLDGKTDWRLPDRHELASIKNRQELFPNLKNYHYWSSSTNNRYNDYAWGLTPSGQEMFDDGYKKDHYYSRCVRGDKPADLEAATLELQEEQTSSGRKKGDTKGDRWGFVLAPTYVSGLASVVDLFSHNYDQLGYTVEQESGYPIGVAFNQYLLTRGMLRLGFGIGPFVSVAITGTSDDSSFHAIPLNISAGITSSLGIYGKAGISKPNASGEFVISERFGFLAAAGYEMPSDRAVTFGFELGLDTSTVTVRKYTCRGWTETFSGCAADEEVVTPVGITASALIVF